MVFKVEVAQRDAHYQCVAGQLDAEREQALVAFLGAGGTEEQFSVYWRQHVAELITGKIVQHHAELQSQVREWF